MLGYTTVMARTDKKVGYSPTGKLEDVTPDMAAHGIEGAFRMLEGRWKMVIIFHLFARDVLRFSEFEKAIPTVSQKMLIQQLRELERDGLVSRTVYPQVPPKVEYKLTEWGKAMCPADARQWAALRPNVRPAAVRRGTRAPLRRWEIATVPENFMARKYSKGAAKVEARHAQRSAALKTDAGEGCDKPQTGVAIGLSEAREKAEGAKKGSRKKKADAEAKRKPPRRNRRQTSKPSRKPQQNRRVQPGIVRDERGQNQPRDRGATW